MYLVQNTQTIKVSLRLPAYSNLLFYFFIAQYLEIMFCYKCIVILFILFAQNTVSTILLDGICQRPWITGKHMITEQ